MKSKSLRCLAWLVAAAAVLFADAPVKAADPIKIGFGMSLTGPLSPNGKMSLVAMQIWEDDTNAKGGLLGRPVKLVYYDDQSSPSQVPSIYAKLLDIDKVDLIVSGYASLRLLPRCRSRFRRRSYSSACLVPVSTNDLTIQNTFR